MLGELKITQYMGQSVTGSWCVKACRTPDGPWRCMAETGEVGQSPAVRLQQRNDVWRQKPSLQASDGKNGKQRISKKLAGQRAHKYTLTIQPQTADVAIHELNLENNNKKKSILTSLATGRVSSTDKRHGKRAPGQQKTMKEEEVATRRDICIYGNVKHASVQPDNTNQERRQK